MLPSSHAIFRTFLLVGLLALRLDVSASAKQKHGHHPSHHAKQVISSAQARSARQKKIQLGAKLHGLHSHMHSVRAKLHSAKVKENRIAESIGTVQARLKRTRARLARVNNRLARIASEHVVVVRRLETTEERLATRRRLLGARIRDTYQRSQTTYAQVMLRSRSVHDLLSRGYYVRQIVHSDAELVHGVQQDVKQIEADKKIIEAQAEEQHTLAAEYEEQKQQFAEDLGKEQQLLHNARVVKAEVEQELDDLEEEANAMTDRIRNLSDMLRQRQEAERQAAIAARAARRHHKPSPGQQDEDDNDPEVPGVWHGSFIRPCSGPVTSGFGYRYHPILHRRKLHTGIDFGAHYGAAIHAAGGGTVIFAAYTRGYGNCVILDHGNGTTTLYGHCSSLGVSEGQVVSQGQTIARVGATGMATGPHLHFELRRNGVPVAPN